MYWSYLSLNKLFKNKYHLKIFFGISYIVNEAGSGLPAVLGVDAFVAGLWKHPGGACIMTGIAKEIHYFPDSSEISPYFWWILNPRSGKVLLLLVELRWLRLQKPSVISPLTSKSLWHIACKSSDFHHAFLSKCFWAYPGWLMGCVL